MDQRTLARLSRFVLDGDGCWLWTGTRTSGGYGQVRINGRAQQAHRVIYELVVGLIPEELCLDHLCRVRRCVNPAHVEPVTNQLNVWRGIALVNMGVCRAGLHDVEMTGILQDNGYQRCRECRRESQRRWLRKQVA